MRIIASVVVFVFTVTTVAWADGQGGIISSFQKEIKSIPTASNLHSQAAVFDIDSFRIPSEIGVIKSAFQGTQDRLVVHIQDAHVNEEAQRNIARVIDYMNKTIPPPPLSSPTQWGEERRGGLLVAVEGASGDLDTTLFAAFPDEEARTAVADYYLREGVLTGPEHIAITKLPKLKLFGAEETQVYEQNRKAFLDSLEFKDRSIHALSEIRLRLDQISRFVFSNELRRLRDEHTGFVKEKSYLSHYVRYLVELSDTLNVSSYPYRQMESFLNLVKLEKEIDFDKAEKEIDLLIGDLKKILDREELSRFVTNSIQFRLKKMTRAEYYGYLEDKVSGHSEAEAKYQNVLKYLNYTRSYEAIGIELFTEIDQLEEAIKNKLFRNESEVKLDRLYRFLDILDHIFDFSLTKDDVDYFYTYRDEFKADTFRSFVGQEAQKANQTLSLPVGIRVIDQDLPKIEEFYKAALKRDKILIHRAHQKMVQESRKTAVIVTGGFHTPGIERYLKEQDISYLVVTPRIAKAIDEQKEARLYEAAMRSLPTRLEQMLTEIYLPPKSSTLNDPRYQLGVVNRFFPDDTKTVDQVSKDPAFLLVGAALKKPKLFEGLRSATKAQYQELTGVTSDAVDRYYGPVFQNAQVYFPGPDSQLPNPTIFYPLPNGGYFDMGYAEIMRASKKSEVSLKQGSLKQRGGRVRITFPLNGDDLIVGVAPRTIVPEGTVRIEPFESRAEVQEYEVPGLKKLEVGRMPKKEVITPAKRVHAVGEPKHRAEVRAVLEEDQAAAVQAPPAKVEPKKPETPRAREVSAPSAPVGVDKAVRAVRERLKYQAEIKKEEREVPSLAQVIPNLRAAWTYLTSKLQPPPKPREVKPAPAKQVQKPEAPMEIKQPIPTAEVVKPTEPVPAQPPARAPPLSTHQVVEKITGKSQDDRPFTIRQTWLGERVIKHARYEGPEKTSKIWNSNPRVQEIAEQIRKTGRLSEEDFEEVLNSVGLNEQSTEAQWLQLSDRIWAEIERRYNAVEQQLYPHKAREHFKSVLLTQLSTLQGKGVIYRVFNFLRIFLLVLPFHTIVVLYRELAPWLWRDTFVIWAFGLFHSNDRFFRASRKSFMSKGEFTRVFTVHALEVVKKGSQQKTYHEIFLKKRHSWQDTKKGFVELHEKFKYSYGAISTGYRAVSKFLYYSIGGLFKVTKSRVFLAFLSRYATSLILPLLPTSLLKASLATAVTAGFAPVIFYLAAFVVVLLIAKKLTGQWKKAAKYAVSIVLLIGLPGLAFGAELSTPVMGVLAHPDVYVAPILENVPVVGLTSSEFLVSLLKGISVNGLLHLSVLVGFLKVPSFLARHYEIQKDLLVAQSVNKTTESWIKGEIGVHLKDSKAHSRHGVLEFEPVSAYLDQLGKSPNTLEQLREAYQDVSRLLDSIRYSHDGQRQYLEDQLDAIRATLLQAGKDVPEREKLPPIPGLKITQASKAFVKAWGSLAQDPLFRKSFGESFKGMFFVGAVIAGAVGWSDTLDAGVTKVTGQEFNAFHAVASAVELPKGESVIPWGGAMYWGQALLHKFETSLGLSFSDSLFRAESSLLMNIGFRTDTAEMGTRGLGVDEVNAVIEGKDAIEQYSKRGVDVNEASAQLAKIEAGKFVSLGSQDRQGETLRFHLLLRNTELEARLRTIEQMGDEGRKAATLIRPKLEVIKTLAKSPVIQIEPHQTEETYREIETGLVNAQRLVIREEAETTLLKEELFRKAAFKLSIGEAPIDPYWFLKPPQVEPLPKTEAPPIPPVMTPPLAVGEPSEPEGAKPPLKPSDRDVDIPPTRSENEKIRERIRAVSEKQAELINRFNEARKNGDTTQLDEIDLQATQLQEEIQRLLAQMKQPKEAPSETKQEPSPAKTAPSVEPSKKAEDLPPGKPAGEKIVPETPVIPKVQEAAIGPELSVLTRQLNRLLLKINDRKFDELIWKHDRLERAKKFEEAAQIEKQEITPRREALMNFIEHGRVTDNPITLKFSKPFIGRDQIGRLQKVNPESAWVNREFKDQVLALKSKLEVIPAVPSKPPLVVGEPPPSEGATPPAIVTGTPAGRAPPTEALASGPSTVSPPAPPAPAKTVADVTKELVQDSIWGGLVAISGNLTVDVVMELQEAKAIRETELRERTVGLKNIKADIFPRELRARLRQDVSSEAQVLARREDLTDRFVLMFLNVLDPFKDKNESDFRQALTQALSEAANEANAKDFSPADRELLKQHFSGLIDWWFGKERYADQGRPPYQLALPETDPLLKNLNFKQVVDRAIAASQLKRDQLQVLADKERGLLAAKGKPTLDLILFGGASTRGAIAGGGIEFKIYLIDGSEKERMDYAREKPVLTALLNQEEVVTVVFQAARLWSDYQRAVAERNQLNNLIDQMEKNGIRSIAIERTETGEEAEASEKLSVEISDLRARLRRAEQWAFDIETYIARLMGVSGSSITFDLSFMATLSDPKKTLEMIHATVQDALKGYGIERGFDDRTLNHQIAERQHQLRELSSAYEQARGNFSLALNPRILVGYGADFSWLVPFSAERGVKTPSRIYQIEEARSLVFYANDIRRTDSALAEMKVRAGEAVVRDGVVVAVKEGETDQRLRNAEEQYRRADELFTLGIQNVRERSSFEALSPIIAEFLIADLSLEDARKGYWDMNLELDRLTQRVREQDQQIRRDEASRKFNREYYERLSGRVKAETVSFVSEGPLQDIKHGVNWDRVSTDFDQQKTREILIDSLMKDNSLNPYTKELKRLSKIEEKQFEEVRRIDAQLAGKKLSASDRRGLEKSREKILDQVKQNSVKKYEELGKVLNVIMPPILEAQLARVEKLLASGELVPSQIKLHEYLRENLKQELTRLGQGRRAGLMPRISLEKGTLEVSGAQEGSTIGVGPKLEFLVGGKYEGDIATLYFALQRADAVKEISDVQFASNAIYRYVILIDVNTRVQDFESQREKAQEKIEVLERQIKRLEQLGKKENVEAKRVDLQYAKVKLIIIEDGLRSLKAERDRAV
ncbi:MAG: hypothetical protein HYS55_05945, partial [Candidatus Omnitrophica bacterium]|nr:hypothetical protein [Candidatus Omnitrophota bacterium]